MSGRIFKGFIAGIVLFCALSLQAAADGGTYSSYSPYSIFGIGDMILPGTALNHGMGGVGIALRNKKFINPLNPAAVTARDSLAFMADFSVRGENKYFGQGDIRSVNNVFNVSDGIISFPIWRSSAMMVGIMPLSGTGFGYKSTYTNPEVIGVTGPVSYAATGTGSVYQLFAGIGATFWKRLSIGAQFTYLFGNIEKSYYQTFTQTSLVGANTYYELQLTGFGGKFGLQYEQPLGSKASMCLGATYSLSTPFRGYVEKYKLSTGTGSSDKEFYFIDTLAVAKPRVRTASEKGVGLALKFNDRWMIEFDYTRSDWGVSNFDTHDGFAGNLSVMSGKSWFTSTVAETYRLGFEIVPNKNDIRYYMLNCAYRAGVYFKKDYFLLDGSPIYGYGITVGMTFPVFRWHNGISIALEFARRGFDFGRNSGVANNLIRESCFNFTVGINVFDIWFQKPRYE
ncbi:MAG: hypothetical protein J5764_00190 [Bacteroidales bacterium]|nr:hypothetical protein [Bacteroidales bacterium]MBO4446525.1 hypothetical protein [Bacteroidales bacterium]